MRRTTPGLFEELEPLIAAAGARHPQWLVLIEPLREVASVADDPVWDDAAGRATLPNRRDADAPVLHGARLAAPAQLLAQLITRVTAWSVSVTDAVTLIEGAIRADRRRIDRIAFAADQDAAALATLADLAAMPLLQSCARVHHARIPQHWSHGYCPVCGTWPVSAELVGIDRSRDLRCGRCAAGWRAPQLRCPYCGEQDHERLGSLVPEATRETRFIETCKSCGGYIKTFTTLTPAIGFELTIKDLDSVELDLAAIEQGFARPAEPGFRLDVQLAAG